MERIILDTLRNGAWVGDLADGNHRGYALTLFGSVTVAGRLTIARPCAGPEIEPPICGFGAGNAPLNLNVCYRGRCEREGVSLDDAYVANDTRTDPTDRYPISYSSATFPGRVTYDPNPFVSYRIDLTGPRPEVTADLEHGLHFTPAEGPKVDLSHVGRLTVTRSGSSIDSMQLSLRFSNISAQGPVMVELELDRNGSASGSVSGPSGRLATISGGDRPIVRGPVYRWESECASPSVGAVSR